MGAGDMPVVLMFDGPSLGGFVCPATITSSQLWKMGQVAANDQILFKRQTLGEATFTPAHQTMTFKLPGHLTGVHSFKQWLDCQLESKAECFVKDKRAFLNNIGGSFSLLGLVV